MKKSFILLMLTCFSFNGYSQEYKPLLDNFNEWRFTTCYFGCFTDFYYTNGDTLVDGLPYKVLDGYHFISRTFLLREDVPEQKVYFKWVDPSGNSDYLLYDFSLNEGDSFEMYNPITPFPEQAGEFIVDSIRPRILEDGAEYRHYYFSPSPNNTISDNNCVWIEGVGSLSLINAPSGDPDINEVGHLSCFFKNGISFYTNLDSITSCTPFLSVNDILKPLSEIVLIKKDQENHFEITSAQRAVNIAVYDLSGKNILRFSNSGVNTISLDFSLLASGLYLVLVESADGYLKTLKAIVE